MTVLLWAILGASLLQVSSFAQSAARVPGACEEPAQMHTGKVGCYLVATTALGVFSAPSVYWHLYEYGGRADAEAAAGPRSTFVESQGRIWVYTIADKDWLSRSGKRVAIVGPLSVSTGRQYTARYMEALFEPGMRTAVHRHSGAEAWYLLAGTQCLETPEGITVVKAGEAAVIREGPPMMLSSVGTETRRSVLLVLHDSTQPWTSPVTDWKPAGRCPK
jgi:quercetin dioxygenase-like cupin family protein